MFHVNVDDGISTDITAKFDVSEIENIYYHAHDKAFYILANWLEEKLGFFVIEMNEKDCQNSKFLIKWKNKLNIADAHMYMNHTH